MSKGEGNAISMNDLVAEMDAFVYKELEGGVEANPAPKVVAQINEKIAKNRARMEGYRNSQKPLEELVDTASKLGQEKVASFYEIPSDENAPDKNGAAE